MSLQKFKYVGLGVFFSLFTSVILADEALVQEASVDDAKEGITAFYDLYESDYDAATGAKVEKLIFINFFGHGSSKLNAVSKPKMEKMCTFLKKVRPNTIQVIGFTDNIERTLGINLVISQNRAEAISGYIEENECITERVEVIAEGRGSADPMFDNATDEGRKKNRRIEVVLQY